MSDTKDAKQSLKEEKAAIHDYGVRAGRASDKGLKEIFHHNRSEEREHASMLRRHLRRRGRSGSR